MTRWSTLLLDDASLAQMPELPVDHVLRHADLVTAQQPKPQALYERWEKQQWNAQAIDLEQDRLDYEKRLPRDARKALEESIATFIIGEYTGLDLLAPILTGAPEEIDHLYLGTQIADETRHTQLMLRLGEEVLGLDPDPKRMLVQAWNMCTPPHRALSRLETEIIREIQHRPSDYEAWLRTVALFHLISEGVLALVGQRAIVRSLHDIPMLPGVKAGFTAMCRDESRHVSFGLHALRQGVREGYTEAICDVIEQAAPLALRIEEGGAVEDAPEGTSMRDLGIDSLRRQLRLIGVDDVFAEHVVGLVTRPAPAEGH
ncbi:ribonucleotide-diphosphate reductase subunit beta [Streptomyces sp. XM83C]|jgi:ribonucleotide reductase beta subunit family protein with ferritin-like domain|uniref:Ribonucleotide-diphosphate reductase subunit beta n=1 Tax=Streptomyces thermocoprophilus TaxID=78356 RepID=A0ABV5VIG2_9ACTN|nr:ribonucleotide-diphosphate reductase subunit beta [Streptomyces sp. XM83C]MCK1820283.1 ribonucleotide-diphosphate reductase subunit beta [Streptomyces sp. XM83C]